MTSTASSTIFARLASAARRRASTPIQSQSRRKWAAQLTIATVQTRLLAQVKAHAAELDVKVRERTQELESFSGCSGWCVATGLNRG